MPYHHLYKQRFFTCMLIFSYAYMHFNLCASLSLATNEILMQGNASLPFGQRLLIPWLQNIIHSRIPMQTSDLFFLCELCFCALLYFFLKQLMKTAFEVKQATLLSWLFLLLLPLITIVNYRLTMGGKAPLVYTYDTPTLCFMMAGYYCCLKEKWLFFYILIFLATLNRESSLLLILLIPALYWHNKRHIVTPFLISSCFFLIAKIIVAIATAHLSGSKFFFYKLYSTKTLFLFNLQWLFGDERILLFLFCMAGLPFLWFTFYDYIPLKFRPLRYVCLFYFTGLLCVGVFPESRIFTEIVSVLYLPVCIALHKWLHNEPPESAAKTGVRYFVNRYAVISILIGIVLFCNKLDPIVVSIAGTNNNAPTQPLP